MSADKSRRGQRTIGAAEAARKVGNPSGILGAQRADGHARYAAGAAHRWSFWEDADGLTPRLNLPARIGGLERAREADILEPKGVSGVQRPGWGRFPKFALSNGPTRPEGEQGLGWEVLLPTATAASACTIGVGGQEGRVV